MIAVDCPGMRLISFKVIGKGALVGIATVELPIGLGIEDCPILINKDGKPWAALPARPVLDREGRHVKPAGAKGQYAALLKWRDRGLADRWSAAVVALVREQYPEVFEERAA